MYSESLERQRSLLSSMLPVVGLASVAAYPLMTHGGEAGIYRVAFRAEYVVSPCLLDRLLLLVITASPLQMISFSYYIGEENAAPRKQAMLNLIFVVFLQAALVPKPGRRPGL